MKLNKLIYAVFFSIAALSCTKETALSPDTITPEYTLPQGNHVYDARIVDFHTTNGTYILYKYNSNDFRWNITNLIPYVADEADEAWVEPSLDFLEDQLFNFYNPSFLKKILPYKIMLASRIRKTVPKGSAIDTLPTPVMATYTFSHLAFGYCNSQLNSLVTSEIQEAKAQLHQSFWASAIQGGRIELPPVFIGATNYASLFSSNIAQHGVFPRPTTAISYTLVQDMIDYISIITSNTKTELENSIFLPAKDPRGRFRFKYNAIIDYYKTTYQIDLQAIGGY